MIACATGSAEATRRLGEALAGLVSDGDVVVLSGDLGAGKTALVQGMARALGVSTPVTSPTFTLANRYHGTVEINHVDVFRLARMDEVHDIDLPELLESGVTVIEWGDRIQPVLPPDQLEILIQFGTGDDERVIELRPTGARWMARRRDLREALAEWIPAAEPGAGGAAPC